MWRIAHCQILSQFWFELISLAVVMKLKSRERESMRKESHYFLVIGHFSQGNTWKHQKNSQKKNYEFLVLSC